MLGYWEANIRSAYYFLENKKRDQNAAQAVPGTEVVAYDFLDLTDKEHVGFRYVLWYIIVFYEIWRQISGAMSL